MRIITTLLITLAVTGCASNKTYKAPMQNYDGISITGELHNNTHMIKDANSWVEIAFDGKQQINVPLDLSLRGEALGNDYQGQKTSASCSSQLVTKQVANINCMVFIADKRTVTLTF